MVQVVQAWRMFMDEVAQIRVDHAPPGASQDKRVKREWANEAPWRTAVERCEAAVPQTAAAAEFFFLLQTAADSRAHHLRRLMTPQTAMELVSDTCAFERWDRIWEAGLRETVAGRQAEAAPQAIMWQAVQAMRQELREGLAWQRGALQEHPHEEVRAWGNILFAGVMRSIINKDFPGLWPALAQEGNPEEVLLKRLPPAGWLGWHDSSRESLEAIRNRVVRVLTQNDSQAPRDAKHAQFDELDQRLGEALSPAPDDTIRLLELEDLV
jgi:hypothetical protein